MTFAYTERTKSIITGENHLEYLHELTHFPVFIGCTDQSAADDLYANMSWDICRDSGMIQLRKLLPLELVYSAYHSEAVGGIWADHHRAFATFVSAFQPRHVLEIGGSNGILARTCIETGDINSWTIVEPNPSGRSEGKIRLLKAFFDEHTIINHEIDAIVHSHTLEHMYDPDAFLANLNERLKVGQHHIFSIPNLDLYLRKRFANSINYEHTYFLTDYFCEYMLGKHGFEIVERSHFGEHSVFFACTKTDQRTAGDPANHYEENKRIYLDMIRFHVREAERLNALMGAFDGAVFLFGAHIFSQMLIHSGLKADRISGIIDNSTLKTGKRLYGTNLHVAKPDIVIRGPEVAVIVKAGQYQEEVKSQLCSLRPDLRIWE